MNKKLKKIIALVLSLIMILSASAACLSAFAADETADRVEVVGGSDEGDHPAHSSFTEIFINFYREIFNFFKYIFYDVFLGKDVPAVPPMVQE